MNNQRLDLDQLLALGYQPLPARGNALTCADSPKRTYSPDQFDGRDVALRLGVRADGSYSTMYDLDAHRASQDPHAALAAFLELPFAHKLAVKRSTSGSGFHILTFTPSPLLNNQKFYIAGLHVGEVFCLGGHMPLIGEWIRGDLSTVELLTADEFEALSAFATVQIGTRSPSSWTARSREGLALIRGWRDVETSRYRDNGGMPKIFAGAEQKHRIAQANYRYTKTAKKGERSNAYAMYVESLMLLATQAYGSDLEEKCRTIAAIAIQDCPKAGDKGYDAERDTAALIGRILHSDPYRNGSGHFKVPFWAKAYQPAVNPPHRPAKVRRKQLDTLRNLLLRSAIGNRVDVLMARGKRHKLTTTRLANALRVDQRTVRSYLAELEANGEIARVAQRGRNGRLEIVLLPHFNHSQRNTERTRPAPLLSSAQPTNPEDKCTEKRGESVQKIGSLTSRTSVPNAHEAPAVHYITSEEECGDVSARVHEMCEACSPARPDHSAQCYKCTGMEDCMETLVYGGKNAK